MEASGERRPDLVPGTLEMLILQTLANGPMHGYGVARQIWQSSGDVLKVEEGSLYPALQRLLRKGWAKAEWATTENKRQARYYRLTPSGHKQLAAEVQEYRRVTEAIARVLQLSEA